MTNRRRQSIIWISLAIILVVGLILISRLCAGEKAPPYEIDVIGGGPQAEGTHPYGPVAVPPGSTRVGVRVNRAAFSQPGAEISLTIEAWIRGEWVLIKQTPRAPGGVLLVDGKPQAFATSFVDLPADTIEIRGVLAVFGSPTNVPTSLVFE